MKRTTTSRVIACLVLGTSAFALSGCQSNNSDAVLFDSDLDCQTSDTLPEGMTPAQCEEQKVAAKAEYLETAPRYDALDVCEEQHGVGNCEVDPAITSSGGSSFMPFMAGYMISNVLNNNSSSYASRPLVPTSSGKFSTTDNRARVSSLNGNLKVANKTLLAKPAATLGKPPMTRATIRSTGGFGKSSTSSFSRSSFGG